MTYMYYPSLYWLAVAGSVMDDKLPDELIAACMDTYGVPDCIINNAGFLWALLSPLDPAVLGDHVVRRTCMYTKAAFIRVNRDAPTICVGALLACDLGCPTFGCSVL